MIAKFVKLDALFCRTAALALLASTLTSPATADVYRWVETDGTVNYGERVPQNVEYTVVSRSAPAKAGSRIINRGRNKKNAASQDSQDSSPATTAQSAQDNMTDSQKQALGEFEAAEAARVAAVNKLRKENCASSKRALSSLQASGRIRVRDENGEESAMSEEDRSKKISEMQKSIVINCDKLS